MGKRRGDERERSTSLDRRKKRRVVVESPEEKLVRPPSETAKRLSVFNPWKNALAATVPPPPTTTDKKQHKTKSKSSERGKTLAFFDAKTGEGWVWKSADVASVIVESGKLKRCKSEEKAQRWLSKKVAKLEPPAPVRLSGGYQKQRIELARKSDQGDFLPFCEPAPGSPLRRVESVGTQEPKLTPQQQDTLRLAVYGGISMLITGGAGTGKSVLLRAIVRGLIKQHGAGAVGVTATTGIAGLHIGGQTLHSWAGIGLGSLPFDALYQRIAVSRVLQKRWRDAVALVIDEVSMLDARLFDILEKLARKLRSNSEPFGGIQLVLCGDFFQLPPVAPEGMEEYESPFAFDAKAWKLAVPRTVVLRQVFRQRERLLVQSLESVRRGMVTPQIAAFFMGLQRNVDDSDGIRPAELFSKRAEVHTRNAEMLAELHGIPHTFVAADAVRCEERKIALADLARSSTAPKVLELRVGAQVMLNKNLGGGLVNGTLGVVIGFGEVGKDLTPEAVETLRETTELSGRYFETELEREEKQEPVEGAAALPLFAAQVGRTSVSSLGSERLYPRVRFSTGLAKDQRIERVMTPEAFHLESPLTGEIRATRYQVPLILAWALSIHKAQGQTMNRVKVNLGSIFESGQAYVALSRATFVEGLQVLDFSAEKVQADQRVIEWFEQQEAERGVVRP